jgi:NAD(P)-dependent dehydrogenase (short-subunit alcohol dehydrogenase family)
MGKKHVLITGAASGLGLGCARQFRRLGYDLTIADLDLAGAQRALEQLQLLGTGAARLSVEPIDLADPASIAACAERLLQAGRPIDVLVNNAGIYAPSQRRLSGEGQELTFAIAHLGHFRLTQALWPLLRQAPAARVVSVSSMVQRQAQLYLDDLTLAQDYQPIEAYRQAKLACLLFAQELQRRLSRAGSPIQSYAAHPGVCRTGIGQHRPRSPGDSAWQGFTSKAMAWGLRYVGQTPDNGAASVIAAATTSDFEPGSLIGPRWLLESFGAPARSRLGPAARDAELAARLWARTEQLTGAPWTPA